MDVENLMTRDVFVVTENTEIANAAQLLKDQKISGAPVVSNDGQPVGIVSLEDFADPACPDDGLVGEVMERRVAVVDSSATLREAAELMVAEAEHRLLVVANGRMVGILSVLDVIPGLLRQLPED